MKTLPTITPTADQLPIILNTKPGVMLIRGAAGSGKTTTAILRLRQLAAFWLNRRTRLGLPAPVRMLVITFNRTLRGYIADLAEEQVKDRTNLELEVSTFAKWSKSLLGQPSIIPDSVRTQQIQSLSKSIPLPFDFLLDEVDYLTGRFPPSHIRDYLSTRREGRGASPRVDHALRQRILNEVVAPYGAFKVSRSNVDWNDLSTMVLQLQQPPQFDVIIADEAQDLSANQVRALLHCAAKPSSVTFVLDAAQRIYPRGFTWKEVGLDISHSNSHRLPTNYRNTVEICRFAAPLLDGMELGDDGTFPDFNSCTRHGDPPLVLKGTYKKQLAYVLRYLTEKVNLANESVAFLKPKGGRWFDSLKAALHEHSFAFVEVTRKDEWPGGACNIALSTMSSGKGLEFDHVIILGLNEEVTPTDSDPQDTALATYRRLLAMAITRARRSVIVGYKPGEASRLTKYLDASTHNELEL